MKKRDPIERFMEKVAKTPGGCWLWTGKIHKKNRYGVFSVGHARHKQAHRWFYEMVRGPVGAKLELDHLCRVRGCVNPDHLEPVTRQVNQLRGDTIAARHAVKTKCPQSHPYSAENTYLYRGSRYCQICRDAHRLKNRLKNKQVKALPLLFLEGK